MNNTRWQKLVDAIDELPFPPPYSRKDVLNDDYAPFDKDVWYIGDYIGGVLPYYSIEWLEIKPRRLVHQGRLLPDKMESIESEFVMMLGVLNIPYKQKNGSYFIYNVIKLTARLIIHVMLSLVDLMSSFEFTPGPNWFCCSHEKSMKVFNQLYDNFTRSFKKQKKCVFRF